MCLLIWAVFSGEPTGLLFILILIFVCKKNTVHIQFVYLYTCTRYIHWFCRVHKICGSLKVHVVPYYWTYPWINNQSTEELKTGLYLIDLIFCCVFFLFENISLTYGDTISDEGYAWSEYPSITLYRHTQLQALKLSSKRSHRIFSICHPTAWVAIIKWLSVFKGFKSFIRDLLIVYNACPSERLHNLRPCSHTHMPGYTRYF